MNTGLTSTGSFGFAIRISTGNAHSIHYACITGIHYDHTGAIEIQSSNGHSVKIKGDNLLSLYDHLIDHHVSTVWEFTPGSYMPPAADESVIHAIKVE